MGKIIYSKNLEDKLNDLVDILLDKQYFAYIESSFEYVQRICDFIETIASKPIKLCKETTYREYYSRYNVPKSGMQYYITFDTMDEIYYIEDIISPKTKAYLAILGV